MRNGLGYQPAVELPINRRTADDTPVERWGYYSLQRLVAPLASLSQGDAGSLKTAGA